MLEGLFAGLGCLGIILLWAINFAVIFGLVALAVWLVSLVISAVTFSWWLVLIVSAVIVILKMIF